MILPRIRAALPVALGAALVAGCGDDVSAPTPPVTSDIVVPVSVFGTEPDPGGYLVTLTADGAGDLGSEAVAPEGGATAFRRLDAGTDLVGVESASGTCDVEGDNPRTVVAEEGGLARVDVAVSCVGPGVSATYERTDPGPYGRFFLQRDGRFLLDHGLVHPTGPSEFGGTHATAGSEISFVFDDDPAWSATGTLDGDCMTVAFSLEMVLTGFEPGEYCLLPAP